MNEYSRVSDKVCKSTVIDEISTDISYTEKEIADVHNNILGLNSPRNCFLYGDSIENFESLLVGINQSLVKLNERFSYFDEGLEEIETSSSQQINEIEVPTIHSAELHNFEFSIPSTNTNPSNTTITHEQQNPIYENTTNQEDTSVNYETQVQMEQDNFESQVMSNSLQEDSDELFASNDDNDVNNISDDSDLSNNDSYNIEFEDSDELSFPEVDVKEDAPFFDNVGATTGSDTKNVKKDESSGGFNAALAGGIAAAIGAVGAGAAFAYSNMKKDEEKDDESQRGD